MLLLKQPKKILRCTWIDLLLSWLMCEWQLSTKCNQINFWNVKLFLANGKIFFWYFRNIFSSSKKYFTNFKHLGWNLKEKNHFRTFKIMQEIDTFFLQSNIQNAPIVPFVQVIKCLGKAYYELIHLPKILDFIVRLCIMTFCNVIIRLMTYLMFPI